MNKSVFISGKVTAHLNPWGGFVSLRDMFWCIFWNLIIIAGLWRPWIYIKFLFWDFILCMRGYEPFNPVRNIPKNTPYDTALNMCLGYLNDCEYIFFIPGCRKSPGSKKEFKEAVKQGKELVNRGKDIYFRFMIEKLWNIDPPEPSFEGVEKLINDLKKH